MGHSLFPIFLKVSGHEIPNGKCYAKLDGYFVDMMDYKIDKIFWCKCYAEFAAE